MSNQPAAAGQASSTMSVPAFWPIAMASALMEEGVELYARNLKFVAEEIKIQDELRPALATPNKVRLDLRTMVRVITARRVMCRRWSLRLMRDIRR